MYRGRVSGPWGVQRKGPPPRCGVWKFVPYTFGVEAPLQRMGIAAGQSSGYDHLSGWCRLAILAFSRLYVIEHANFEGRLMRPCYESNGHVRVDSLFLVVCSLHPCKQEDSSLMWSGGLWEKLFRLSERGTCKASLVRPSAEIPLSISDRACACMTPQSRPEGPYRLAVNTRQRHPWGRVREHPVRKPKISCNFDSR